MSTYDEVVMPDFKTWGENTSRGNVEQALRQAFDQGRALGFREGRAINNTQEWWEYMDDDEEYQAMLADEIQEQDIAILKGSGLYQYLDTASGCYVAIKRGREVGRNCGGKPFRDIPIVGDK